MTDRQALRATIDKAKRFNYQKVVMRITRAEEMLDELEAAEKRIAELEAREVNLPKYCVAEVMLLSGFDRQYAEGWCAGNDNAIHEIRAAGITVKGDSE